MTITREYDDDNPAEDLTSLQHPKPLGSLVAAATRMSGKKIPRKVQTQQADAWQGDAWDMYDLVGEQHFLANTLAGRLSQAQFFVGRLPDDRTEDIEVQTEGAPVDAFETLAGPMPFFSQMIARTGLNLFMAGDCWMLGAPPDTAASTNGSKPSPIQMISPILDDQLPIDVDISTLNWTVHSTSEISFDNDENVQVKSQDGNDTKTYDINKVFLIRIWRPHPRYWWESDSATRASLPILRELVGLTMHISSQIDSRLAGAGVFLIPESADRALRAAAGQEEGTDAESPFTMALMEAMITPINDRASAAAVVPIMPTVPDDSIEKFRYISFAGGLDTEAQGLRDEAIRRLALSQDCPPEILLGTGALNHWGAWLVREDVVVTHLEPPLALICDALTTQFLWPVLEQQGVKDFEQYCIWYDVSSMIMRPDLSGNAKDLHAAGVISDESLRDATGFDESDAPELLPEPVKIVLAMISSAPGLAENPGIPVLLAQVTAMIEGTELPPTPIQTPGAAPADSSAPSDDEPANSDTVGDTAGPPSTSPNDPPPENTDNGSPDASSSSAASDTQQFAVDAEDDYTAMLRRIVKRNEAEDLVARKPQLLDLTHAGMGSAHTATTTTDGDAHE